MKFDSFTVNGKEYPLGYSLFEDNYEYEKDTDIRRSAFSAFSTKIRQYENVTAAAYNAQLQTEKTMATLRGFNSVIDSLLFPQQVSRELYNRQIDLITTRLAPHMRKYARLLKKVHNLDRMTIRRSENRRRPGVRSVCHDRGIKTVHRKRPCHSR